MALDVIGNVSYLKENGLHTQFKNPSALAALCGIRVERNSVVLADSSLAAPALPPSSSRGAHGGDDQTALLDHEAQKDKLPPLVVSSSSDEGDNG